MSDIWTKRLGRVVLDPQGPVTAGSIMEWTLTYTAGEYGVDEGGTIMLVQRMASDMQPPQFDQPDQSAYTTVTTKARCRLEARFQKKQHPRPWQNWCLVIDVLDGYIEPGEQVTIVLGDRSKGSQGIRAQTFVESAHEFSILVDPTNAALLRRLPSSPRFPVVSGPAANIACIIPSVLVAGESGYVFVRGEDVWGNPTPLRENLELSLKGDRCAAIEDMRIRAVKPGTTQVTVSAGEVHGISNPLVVVAKPHRYRRFWGDLHGQTDSTVGTGSEDEFFSFARDQARLDFCSHQGNDFQLSDDDWRRLNQTIGRYHRPGQFVVFPGFEWSGNTPAGGDHNVIYLDDNPPIYRSSHWQVSEASEDAESPTHPAGLLFKRLRQNARAMAIPHVGGRPADVRRFFDPKVERVVEILSCHGVFEWLLWDTLKMGHRVGVVCNSDSHKGRPGAEAPGAGRVGIRGGLTCVLAEELNRESIFKALWERRCYGTSGPRIHLHFEANGRLMGEEFASAAPVLLKAEVRGQAPVETLRLMRGNRLVHQVRPPAFESVIDSNRIRLSWGGAKTPGRGRRAVWDGRIYVENASITGIIPYAFDSPADGIVSWDEGAIQVESSTTGDEDGIYIDLDNPCHGRITFRSKTADCSFDLSRLGEEPEIIELGGVGLFIRLERYPEEINTRHLELEYWVDPNAGEGDAYLIIAAQTDGHKAWSSPIFVDPACSEYLA